MEAPQIIIAVWLSIRFIISVVRCGETKTESEFDPLAEIIGSGILIWILSAGGFF